MVLLRVVSMAIQAIPSAKVDAMPRMAEFVSASRAVDAAVRSVAASTRPSCPSRARTRGIRIGACDGSGADAAEHEAVKARSAADLLPGHDGQERPDGAGEGEEHDGPPEDAVKIAAGAGIAQAGAERSSELLAQAVVGIGCAAPPQEGEAHDDIGENVDAVDGGRTESCEQEASQGRPDGAGDVDAERIERDGSLQVGSRNELRRDRLPCGRRQCGADAAEESEEDEVLDGDAACPDEKGEERAHASERDLNADEIPAAVEDV